MSKFVYFIKPIGMAGPIKIGCAVNPVNRLCGLITWSPFPLEILVTIPGDYTLERNIHHCLADTHSHREWFHPSEKLSGLIAALKAGTPIEEAIDLTKRIGSIRTRAPWGASHRRYMGYKCRFTWASRKLRDDDAYYDEPQDCYDILERWSGEWNGNSAKHRYPTDEEFARLEEVLANPAAYFDRHPFNRRVAA